MDEVRRLQEQFEAVQQATSALRLSEANVVDVIRRLTESKLVTLYYTLDGKEFVTPSKLKAELAGEVRSRGGRVSVLELPAALNVDYSVAEEQAKLLCREDASFSIVASELVSADYLSSVAEEINVALQERGQLHASELHEQHNLPVDYLIQFVQDRLGRGIDGLADASEHGVFYTSAFARRQQHALRGALVATTRPTQLSAIQQTHKLHRGLLWTVLRELMSSNSVPGQVVGTGDRALFVPRVYSRAQAEYVDGALQADRFISFQQLASAGIDDAPGYLARRYTDPAVVMLKGGAVPRRVVDQVNDMAAEALDAHSFVNVAPLLPTALSEGDIAQVLAACGRLAQQQPARSKGKGAVAVDPSAPIVLEQTWVTDGHFVQQCREAVKEAALARVTDAIVALEASLKAGEPLAAPEGKRRGKAGAAPAAASKRGPKPLSSAEAARLIEEAHADAEESFLRAVCSRFVDAVNTEAQAEYEEREAQVIAAMAEADTPAEADVEAARKSERPAAKVSMEEIGTRLDDGRASIVLFLRGARLCDEATAAGLEKYLLKTDCAALHEALSAALSGSVAHNPAKTLALLAECLAGAGGKGASVDQFLEAAETVADSLRVRLSKMDKKRERQILFIQRQALLAQLKEASDAALVLHLAVQFHFQNVRKVAMVHAPGRLVPAVLASIKAELPAQVAADLESLHQIVVKKLTSSEEDDTAATEEAIARVKAAAAPSPSAADL